MASDLQRKLDYILDEKANKIIPYNIRKGVEIFGISGECVGVDSTDATATPEDIREGKTAYVNDQKITGTYKGVETTDATAKAGDILIGRTAYTADGKTTGQMSNNGILQYTPTAEDQEIPNGYTSGGTVKGDANLVAENIKKGSIIFGITGTAQDEFTDHEEYEECLELANALTTEDYGDITVVDTSDATATAEDMALNKTAYVNGAKITGSLGVVDKEASVSLAYDTPVLNEATKDVVMNGSFVNDTIMRAGAYAQTHCSYTTMASLIGLTPDILKAGENVMGVEGTLASGKGESFEDSYQAIEYIQGTGTQYIDTKVLPVAGETTAEVDFQITTKKTSEQWALGIWDSNGWRCGGYYNSSSGNLLDTRFGSSYTSSTFLNRQLGKMTACPFSSTYSLYLFCQNEKGTAMYLSNGYIKLYGCKIWSGEELIRDFIPCYRKSDGVIGLYDKINQHFYINKGTGTFIKGSEKTLEEDLPRNGVYTKLEYLESSDGTQFIDTGVQALSTVGAEVRVLTPNTAECAIFGTWQNENGLLFGQASSGWFGNQCYAVATDSTWRSAGIEFDAGWHTFKYDAMTGISSVDDISIQAPANSGKATNLHLFNGNEYEGSLAGMKISSCKIYDNELLVRDFIPVRYNKTNELGMLDLVEGIFYTNKGPGDFIGGPEMVEEGKIPTCFTLLDYIESTGTQFIDTEYYPNQDTGYELVYSHHLLGGSMFGTFNTINDWASGSGFFLGGLGDNSNFWFQYYSNNNTGISSLNIHAGELIINKNIFTINGDTFTASSKTFTTNYPLLIFGSNNAGTAANFVSTRIHHFTIKEGNTVVRNYVPVIENKTGEIGLYDLIAGKFYQNQGTGAFTAGPVKIKYITNGLVNYYKMQNNLLEEIRGNDGANVGLTFNEDIILNKVVAKTNDGYGFFISRDLPKKDFTLSILVKSDGTNTEANHMLLGYVDKIEGGTRNACCLKVSAGVLGVEYSYDATTTEFNINDGLWHRCTVSLENSNIIKVYVDDQLIVEDSKELTIDENCYGFIGSWYPSLTMFFNGWVADALIYDRVLTLEEIAYNYMQDDIASN